MEYEKIAQAKALLVGTGYGVYPVESVEKMREDLAAPPDYFRPRGGSGEAMKAKSKGAP